MRDDQAAVAEEMMEEQQPSTSRVIEELPLSPRLPFLERYGISPILFAFMALILVFILYEVIGGLVSFLIFGDMPTPENVVGYRIITGASQLLLLLLPTLLLTLTVSLSPQQFLRLRMPDVRTLLVSLVGIFSLQQMMQVYLVFQDMIRFPEPIQSEIQKLKDLIEGIYRTLVSAGSIPELLGVIVIVALIPAFSEELFFRGLVQRNLERGFTPLGGVVLTGLIFAAFHLNPFTFVPLAVLGMYLGFLVMRADCIWVSITAHCFNNLLACLALYFQVKDDYVVVGNANTMSVGGLLFTFWLFGVVFLVSTYYFIKITTLPDTESAADSQ